jgi:hypothetical protein
MVIIQRRLRARWADWAEAISASTQTYYATPGSVSGTYGPNWSEVRMVVKEKESNAARSRSNALEVKIQPVAALSLAGA